VLPSSKMTHLKSVLVGSMAVSAAVRISLNLSRESPLTLPASAVTIHAMTAT